MKILFINVGPHSPHFETQLELMLEHAAKGDELIYLACDRALPFCDANANNDPVFCMACEIKRRRGLAMIGFQGRRVALSSLYHAQCSPDSAPLHILNGIDNFEDLKPLTYDSYDVGETLMGCVFSTFGTCYPVFEETTDLMRRAAVSTLTLYAATRTFLRENRPDLTYFFNGRGATSRCFVRACQIEGFSFYSHERGSRIESYSLWPNTIPHDMQFRATDVVRVWNENPNEAEKRAISATYFNNMRKGNNPHTLKNYLSRQKAKVLPAGWLEAQRRIVLFTSTETEFGAVANMGFWRLYPNTATAMNHMVEGLKKQGYAGKLLVRMHPNSADEAPNILTRFLYADDPMVILVPPEDAVDSYELARTAEKVIVFNSTIGIESVRMGRPVITLNSCPYCDLGVTHTPKTYEEAIQLILADLPVPDAAMTDYLGYYMSCFGHSFKYVTFKGQGQESGRSSSKCMVLGKKLRSPWWLDQLMRLKKKYPWLEAMLQRHLYPRVASRFSIHHRVSQNPAGDRVSH